MKQFFRNNGGLLLVAAVLLAAVVTVGAYILGYDPLSSALELISPSAPPRRRWPGG